MSWENFQEEAFGKTRDEVKKLSKRIISNYRNAIINIEIMLKDLYARHLTGIEPKDYYNEVIKRDRLKNLLKKIKEEYTILTGKNYRDTVKILSLSFSNTYYRKLYAANWLSGNTFGVLPSKLIDLAVLGTDQAFKNIEKKIIEKFGDKTLYMPQKGTLVNLIKNNANRELSRIGSSITQRIINGNSYTKTSEVIRDIIGREFKDEKAIKVTGAKSSAMRIIRTESNRIMNSASYAASKNLESNGIETKRKIVATLDNATRRQSARMDGQTVDIDKPFVYPNGATAFIPGTTGIAKYDINDRETVIDIINGIEPAIRIGRNPATGENEVFEYKYFDTWAEDKGLKKNIYGEYIRK